MQLTNKQEEALRGLQNPLLAGGRFTLLARSRTRTVPNPFTKDVMREIKGDITELLVSELAGETANPDPDILETTFYIGKQFPREKIQEFAEYMSEQIKLWFQLSTMGYAIWTFNNHNGLVDIDITTKGSKYLGYSGLRRDTQVPYGLENQVTSPEQLKPGTRVQKYNIRRGFFGPVMAILENSVKKDENGPYVEVRHLGDYLGFPFIDIDSRLYLEKVSVSADRHGLYHPWTVLRIVDM